MGILIIFHFHHALMWLGQLKKGRHYWSHGKLKERKAVTNNGGRVCLNQIEIYILGDLK
jgi:hypothetical protein